MRLFSRAPAGFVPAATDLPPVSNVARMQNVMEALDAEAENASGRDAAGLSAILEPGSRTRALLESTFGNAPYLGRIAMRDALWLPEALGPDPAATRDALLQAFAAQAAEAGDITELMNAARLAKRRMALLTALADIAKAWPLEDVTYALSALADGVIEQSARWLLRRAARAGEITLADESVLTRGSGLVILAMGKYGAHELNYSSDIDIVVFFEPECLTFHNDQSPSTFFVKLTKDLVRILQEQTATGYVFRTDMRLRPDAGATNVAISVDAAETYYESMGQNWERAAMIKARACAGDVEAGKRFMEMIAPFVWRRYLDYAAIEDIHSLKRQIHAHRGHGVIAIAGHDIKLGRGGIREIEFFVQIQQLIGGGKDPTLRGRATLPMLRRLADLEWIDRETEKELAAAYRFLRTLEHRLQMVEDEQTHRLPKTEEGVAHIAAFMGFKSREAFEKELHGYLTRVQARYAALFEAEPSLSEEEGSLVFTGTEDDPETVETLARMGFERPSDVIAIIRKWHFGRIAATRSKRSRELLTKLTPVILRAMSKTERPQLALTRFDEMLSGLPAGVQFFSLLYQNMALLDLLAEIVGMAPVLASYLARNPAVLEAVILPDFYEPLPDLPTRIEEVKTVLGRASDFEGALDEARIYAREQMFQIGVQVITGTAPAREAGPAYADLAAAMVGGLQPVAEADIRERYGDVPGGLFAVVAMGKLGGREMTATSDLDLITIYEFEGESTESNGPQKIDAIRYFTRTGQRLIAALTVPTPQGQLYEVDMRLRPSGHAGPLATRFRSFLSYHDKSSWTWEKMALTRARVLTGTPFTRTMIESAIHDILCTRRDAREVARDVVDMRERLFKELGSEDLWDLKQGRGGLVDLEFIAQGLQLIHAHKRPRVLDQNTRKAFEKLGAAGVISRGTAAELVAAADEIHNLTQILRIAVEGKFDPATAHEALRGRLARAVDVATFAGVERDLADTKARVHELFERLITRLA